MRILRLNDRAKVPTRGSEAAAGLDLYACKRIIVPGKGWAKIGTGIAVALAPSTFGSLRDRSGLASNYGITVLGGVVDSDYRGEIGVILANLSMDDFIVEVGDRIAQLVIQPCILEDIVEVTSLDDTDRGQSGFGSTGRS